MLNAVKSVLAEVSSVKTEPFVRASSMLWRRANARNVSQHTLYGVQHIHINLTLIHSAQIPWWTDWAMEKWTVRLDKMTHRSWHIPFASSPVHKSTVWLVVSEQKSYCSVAEIGLATQAEHLVTMTTFPLTLGRSSALWTMSVNSRRIMSLSSRNGGSNTSLAPSIFSWTIMIC